MSWLVASSGQSTCFINFFKFPELTLSTVGAQRSDLNTSLLAFVLAILKVNFIETVFHVQHLTTIQQVNYFILTVLCLEKTTIEK